MGRPAGRPGARPAAAASRVRPATGGTGPGTAGTGTNARGGTTGAAGSIAGAAGDRQAGTGSGNVDAGASCTIGAFPAADPSVTGPFATVTENNVGPAAGVGVDGGRRADVHAVPSDGPARRAASATR